MAKICFRNLVFQLQFRFLKTAATKAPSSLSTKKSSKTANSAPPSVLTLSAIQTLASKPGHRSTKLLSENAESLITCLNSHGFSETQIALLITKMPILLRSRVNCTTHPKLQWLTDKGFTGGLLAEVVLLHPHILFRSLNSCLKPAWETLTRLLETEDQALVAVRRYARLLTDDLKKTMIPNFNYLLKAGVSPSFLAKTVTRHPFLILQGQDRIKLAVQEVKNAGIQPESHMFTHAVRIRLSMTDSNWKKKLEVFRSLGWSAEDFVFTLKNDPFCFGCSEKKLRRNMDFLVNTVKLDPKAVTRYPKLLKLSLDGINARYHVLKTLQSHKVLKMDAPAWFFCVPEHTFIQNYVKKHLDKVPNLLEVYIGVKKDKKTPPHPRPCLVVEKFQAIIIF